MRNLDGPEGGGPDGPLQLIDKVCSTSLWRFLSDNFGRVFSPGQGSRRIEVEPGIDPVWWDAKDYAHEMLLQHESYRRVRVFDPLVILTARSMPENDRAASPLPTVTHKIFAPRPLDNSAAGTRSE